MKKFLILFVLFSIGVFGQINDGVARPSVGAFWNQGCDGAISKYIYYNISQSGMYSVECNGKTYMVEVELVLDDTKILFQEGNFSSYNRNWVTIYGEKMWRYSSGNTYRLASCGNKIKEIQRPLLSSSVASVNPVISPNECNCPTELEKPVQTQIYQFETPGAMINPGGSPYSYPVQTQPYSYFNQDTFAYKQKTWFGRNWGWFVPLMVGVGVGAYYLIDQLIDTGSNTSNDDPPDEYWGPNPSGPEKNKQGNTYYPPIRNGGGGVIVLSF